MSGFGGGFGSTPPHQSNNPFGAHQQQQQQPALGFGHAALQQQQHQLPFGSVSSSSSPYGSALPTSHPFQAAAPPSSFSTAGAFGQPPPTHAAAAPSSWGGMMFGASPNVATAATSPSAFSSSNQSFQAPAGPFGSSHHNQSHHHTPAPTRFGSTAPFGFAAPSSSFPALSSTQNDSYSFGAPSIQAPSSSNSLFGGGGGESQQIGQAGGGFGGNNPFGAPPPAASTMVFGVSSNVMKTASSSASPMVDVRSNHMNYPRHPAQQPDSLASSKTNIFGGNHSSAPSNKNTTFAAAPHVVSSSMPFLVGSSGTMRGPADDVDNHMVDEGTTKPPPVSNLPFGVPPPQRTGATVSSRQQQQQFSGEDKTRTSQEEKLAALKAKLEAKKRAFQEKKKRSAGSDDVNSSANTSATSRGLNPTAAVFQPRQGGDEYQSGTPPPVTSSLAEKNAFRFANKSQTETQAHLPAELRALQSQGVGNHASLRVDSRAGEAKELHSAVSLVGTCQFMCPDEELMRRERESDIQLLELPLPGKLHPSDWTLRNTVVKRFRRSAADYKLDVPEWIRPPDVLEQVCGYLEEWVMERDRQGPDPRFSNGDGTPPSLDVYQFIWDRTRMVRKDFTLQNYVGTGGNCDARAVRCHERICRWHTMCEHQLSHIPEFVNMQSQQNIQELGQTMKTLNQFYDDSLARSSVEVPDEAGRETRTDWVKYSFGCSADTVQGINPVDYDGNPLVNNNSGGVRLIPPSGGARGHGTAEPEMRGLYVLLTIDNDGGMEVLKYVARLYRDRPTVYHSTPVQLALAVYKAKKEYNYARFFSILSSPSTPYLFACIMFKYVETLRKMAFQIFSKTYGGRTKDSNDPMYDFYPLKTLMRVLCFEDLDEARSACRHFNITVQKDEVKSSSGIRVEEFVRWRVTPFKEPRDPDKGTIIPLKPRKMIRTIESKLKGLTRLAVCRGALSINFSVDAAEGQLPGLLLEGKPEVAQQVQLEHGTQLVDDAKRKEQQEILLQLEKDNRKLADMKRREMKAKEARLQHEESERNQRQQEEEERLFVERQKRLEGEQERRKREEERARQLQADALARRKEEERRLEAERRQQEALEEQERKERLREEQERLRQEQERRRQELEARRQQEEEETRRRQEVERKRIEVERKERERRQEELEAERLYLEWKRQADTSRKEVAWRRLLQTYPRELSMIDQTQETLSRIGRVDGGQSIADSLASIYRKRTHVALSPPQIDGLRRALEMLAQQRTVSPVTAMLTKIAGELASDSENSNGMRERTTLLFKVALVLPDSCRPRAHSLYSLVRMWLTYRLDLGKIFIAQMNCFNIRVVFVEDTTGTCDAAVAVLLPSLSGQGDTRSILREVGSISDTIPKGIPFSILLLADDVHDTSQGLLKSIASAFAQRSCFFHCEVVDGRRGDSGLSSCLWSIIDNLATEASAPRVERVSVLAMCCVCVNKAIWYGSRIESYDDVTKRARIALRLVLDAMRKNTTVGSIRWPSSEFASDGVVKDFFGKGLHLPLDWQMGMPEAKVLKVAALFDGSVFEASSRLLAEAPVLVQRECEALLEERLFRRCLQTAMMWNVKNEARAEVVPDYFYLPVGLLQKLVDDVGAHLNDMMDTRHSPRTGGFSQLENEETLVIRTDDNPSTRSLHLLPTPASYATETDNQLLVQGKPSTSRLAPEITRRRPQHDELERDAIRKRRRFTVSSQSADVRASSAFTERLKGMVGGGIGKNLIVGQTTLSALLRDAHDLVDSND